MSTTEKFSNRLFDIPKLNNDGSNFQTWKFRVTKVLDSRGLQQTVTGDDPKPRGTSDSDKALIAEWIKRDKDTQAQLTLTLEDEPLNGVLYATSAKDIWDKLNSRYEGKGKQTIAFLIRELFRSTLSDESALEPQLNAMRQKAYILHSLGQTLEDSLIATAIVISLPASYSTLATILMASNDKLETDSVMAQILTEEKSRRDSNSVMALIAKTNGKAKGKKDAKKGKKCDHCKKKGHVKAECRKLKAENEAKEKEKPPELTAKIATISDSHGDSTLR